MTPMPLPTDKLSGSYQRLPSLLLNLRVRVTEHALERSLDFLVRSVAAQQLDRPPAYFAIDVLEALNRGGRDDVLEAAFPRKAAQSENRGHAHARIGIVRGLHKSVGDFRFLIGGEPTPSESTALADAHLGHAQRSGLDDFSSLTAFLENNPRPTWAPALLTGLGLEYSLAVEAWAKAWSHAKDATDATGKFLMDRAVGELAFMYARLGRMAELELLLHSVQGQEFAGPATDKTTGAREGLWTVKNRPEIAFRCGPLALHAQFSRTRESPRTCERARRHIATSS